MAAHTMMESNSVKGKAKEENPIDLRDKITVFAPKGAEYHAEGEEVKIHPILKDKFTAKGFTEAAPKAAKKD